MRRAKSSGNCSSPAVGSRKRKVEPWFSRHTTCISDSTLDTFTIILIHDANVYIRSIHKVYSIIWNKRVFATLNFLQILYFYILPFRASPMFKCPKPSADEKKPQMEDGMCCEKSMGKLLELRTLLQNVWKAIIVFTGPDFIQTYSNVRVSSSVSEVPHVVHINIYIYLLYDMRPDMHMLIYIHICIYRYIHMYIDACSSTWPRNQTAPPNALALPTTRPRLQRPLPGNKKNPLRYFFLLEFLPVSTLVNFSSYTPED